MHFDHIGALDDVVNKYEVPLYMNKEEFSFLKDPDKMVLLSLSNMVCL